MLAQNFAVHTPNWNSTSHYQPYSQSAPVDPGVYSQAAPIDPGVYSQSAPVDPGVYS